VGSSLDPLIKAVRRNCDIADARHAGDYTLCVYLAKMREYYRWEKGLPFTEKLPHEPVGNWIRERERLWEEIADEAFVPLPLGEDHSVDPFAADAVNQTLVQDGLVYSAGIGQKGAAHFFLAELERHEEHEGFRIYVSGREHARDLTSPPAMAQGSAIFIRRESLQRMIWEKIEEWRWNRVDNPIGRAIRYYDFERDQDGALEEMTDAQLETLLLHEMGEVLAGRRLGPEWEQMLSALPRSKAEIMVRAVRDHLADALSTLPALVEREQPAALHFYFATLTNMRKCLFPSLVRAYEDWLENGRLEPLARLIPKSLEHWQSLADRMLELYRRHGRDSAPRLQALIDDNTL